MPLYVFSCKKCGDTRDISMSFDEYDNREEIICNCGSVMERAYKTPPDVMYRGNGWGGQDYVKKEIYTD